MSELPVVDPAAIQRLRDWGGPTLPGKLIDVFLGHAPERMRQVRKGWEGRDPAGAEQGAHSLKSSAGNVGAVRLQRMAQEAEALARDGELDRLGALLPDMEAAFEEACAELRELVKEMVP